MSNGVNTKTAITIIIVAGAILGVVFWNRDNIPKATVQEQSASAVSNQNDIISESGIHWHPELSIIIKGEKQLIPANIGLGMQYAGYPQYDSMMMMTDTHTHDASGQIHWEIMEGPVKKDDVRLGQFFNVWGKKFTSSCIFEKCNDAEGRVIFKVNGKDNPDFENYLVKDKDKIEIIFQ